MWAPQGPPLLLADGAREVEAGEPCATIGGGGAALAAEAARCERDALAVRAGCVARAGCAEAARGDVVLAEARRATAGLACGAGDTRAEVGSA